MQPRSLLAAAVAASTLLTGTACGLEADAADIAAMGVGGLLEEGGRPVPWGWSP